MVPPWPPPTTRGRWRPRCWWTAAATPWSGGGRHSTTWSPGNNRQGSGGPHEHPDRDPGRGAGRTDRGLHARGAARSAGRRRFGACRRAADSRHPRGHPVRLHARAALRRRRRQRAAGGPGQDGARRPGRGVLRGLRRPGPADRGRLRGRRRQGGPQVRSHPHDGAEISRPEPPGHHAGAGAGQPRGRPAVGDDRDRERLFAGPRAVPPGRGLRPRRALRRHDPRRQQRPVHQRQPGRVARAGAAQQSGRHRDHRLRPRRGRARQCVGDDGRHLPCLRPLRARRAGALEGADPCLPLVGPRAVRRAAQPARRAAARDRRQRRGGAGGRLLRLREARPRARGGGRRARGAAGEGTGRGAFRQRREPRPAGIHRGHGRDRARAPAGHGGPVRGPHRAHGRGRRHRPRRHRLRLRRWRRTDRLDGRDRNPERHRRTAPPRLQRRGHRQAVERQPAARLAGRHRRRGAAAMKRWLLAALLLASPLLPTPLVGAAQAATASERIDPAEIDRSARATIARYQLPGLALGVIEDGQVVFARGYGETVAGSGEAVDTGTVFKIASNSKAMTAAVLARLVQQGKLRWDDPVAEHLPGFAMHDPWVTEHMTVADLLVHNSGLPEGGGDLMLWPEPNLFTREDIVHGLRYIVPAYGFRAGYAYDNLLYVVAGELAAHVAGVSYEELVRREIFAPLGLQRCVVGEFDRVALGNVAQPHWLSPQGNQPMREDPAVVPPIASAPAGGIRCSLDDMLAWARNWLAPTPAQLEWLGPAQRAEMWKARTPMPISRLKKRWDNTHFYA